MPVKSRSFYIYHQNSLRGLERVHIINIGHFVRIHRTPRKMQFLNGTLLKPVSGKYLNLKVTYNWFKPHSG